jgi:hypothetical protein
VAPCNVLQACRCVFICCAVLCCVLLSGANPNLCDYDGASPLHLAVELQDEECLAGAAAVALVKRLTVGHGRVCEGA